MKYIFDEWDAIKERLHDKQIMLFLDYDGTLSPIADTPEDASLPQETKTILEQLSKMSECQIAIVSGRALRDVKKRIGLKLIYVGNHGFEIEAPKMRFENLISSRFKEILEDLKKEIDLKVPSFPGALIEDKDFTLSIHYRLVNEEKAPAFEKILNEITKPYILRKEIRTGFGKKIFEIKPPIEWDKGQAVSWLLKKQGFAVGPQRIFPIGIGDDITDEDLFLAVKDQGLAIYVGEPRLSHAPYYLRDSGDVVRFLRQIYDLKKICPS